MPRSNARRRIARLSASGRSSPKFCHSPSEIGRQLQPAAPAAPVGHRLVAVGGGGVEGRAQVGVVGHAATIPPHSGRASGSHAGRLAVPLSSGCFGAGGGVRLGVARDGEGDQHGHVHARRRAATGVSTTSGPPLSVVAQEGVLDHPRDDRRRRAAPSARPRRSAPRRTRARARARPGSGEQQRRGGQQHDRRRQRDVLGKVRREVDAARDDQRQREHPQLGDRAAAGARSSGRQLGHDHERRHLHQPGGAGACR